MQPNLKYLPQKMRWALKRLVYTVERIQEGGAASYNTSDRSMCFWFPQFAAWRKEGDYTGLRLLLVNEWLGLGRSGGLDSLKRRRLGNAGSAQAANQHLRREPGDSVTAGGGGGNANAAVSGSLTCTHLQQWDGPDTPPHRSPPFLKPFLFYWVVACKQSNSQEVQMNLGFLCMSILMVHKLFWSRVREVKHVYCISMHN